MVVLTKTQIYITEKNGNKKIIQEGGGIKWKIYIPGITFKI